MVLDLLKHIVLQGFQTSSLPLTILLRVVISNVTSNYSATNSATIPFLHLFPWCFSHVCNALHYGSTKQT